MINYMLIPGLILLNLYICFASPYSAALNGNLQHQGSPSSPFERWLLSPGTSHRNQDLWMQNQTRATNLSELNVMILSNRSDFSINSLEFSGQPTVEDEDKVETHTNNHQSMSSQQQHSRHYSSYQAGHNKYSPILQTSGNHNLNMNYIHSMLAKPLVNSGSLSNLLNSNGNSLGSGSQSSSSPYGLSAQVNAYYSAMSAISPLSNGLLQQLQSLAKPSVQSSSMVDQQQLQQNLTSNTIDFSGSPSCGRQQIGVREPRIVGGNNTYEGEFPWAVSIQRHGNHHCGGVIVGRRWILTAAHCVRSQLVGNLVVRTGGHTLSRSGNSINSHFERDYLVDQIVMHDDFSRYDNLTAFQMKSSANTNNADIALLRLKHDILWNELAWPVCFPHRDSGNFSGHDAIVIGWGKLNEKSEDFSNELQKVKLTIIDNKVCQNWFRQAGREMPIDDRIICAGFKSGGKDACHGDSGGPLLSKINGHYVVVGVVSTGIGCARPLLPGLYSRVSSYINWIERYVA